MASKPKAKAKPAVELPAVKKGDKLTFKGYAEELEDGVEEIFKKGDTLIVMSATKDGDELKVKAHKEDDKDAVETIYMPGEAEVFTGKKPAAKKAAKAAEPDEDEDDEETEDEDEIEDADDAEDDDTLEDDDSLEDDDAEDEDEAPAPKGKAAKSSKAKTKAAKPAKEKSAPARTKDEELDEKITHFKSVQKVIKKGSAEMLEAAKSLVTRAGEAYFNLGGILAEIYATKAYGELGYNKELKVKGEKPKSPFEQYCNTELGIEYRKAMDLIGIYKVFSKIEGIDEAKILKLGYTKMRSIARIAKGLTVDELDGLLDEADEMGRDELEDHIATSYVNATKGGTKKVKRVKYSFSVFADENEYVAKAVETAQGMVESGEVNDALVHIVREWSTMVDGVDVSLDQAIAVLEARFGVKLKVDNGDEAEDGEETPAPKAKAKAAPKAEKGKVVPLKQPAAKKPVAKKPDVKKAAATKKAAGKGKVKA